jgi:hypothetical protein
MMVILFSLLSAKPPRTGIEVRYAAKLRRVNGNELESHGKPVDFWLFLRSFRRSPTEGCD